MLVAMLRIFFVFFAGVLFVSGCGQSQRKHKIFQEECLLVQSQKDLVTELEAKLYDIPIPFHSQGGVLLSDHAKADTSVVLNYSLAIPYADLISFYDKEMEVLGWQQAAFIQGAVALLVFEKPGRLAVLEIKTKQLPAGCEVHELIVFSGKKSEYPDSIK